MSMGLTRLGRRVVLPWGETKTSAAPERDYLLGQLELLLLRHRERANSRVIEPLKIRTHHSASCSSSSSSSCSSCSSSCSMTPPHLCRLGPLFLFRKASPVEHRRSWTGFSVILTSRLVEERAAVARLAEWESLVQSLLLPFVSAPSFVARCKSKLKKVAHTRRKKKDTTNIDSSKARSEQCCDIRV